MQSLYKLVFSILAAVVFYTSIPLPNRWQLDFSRIARWAPLIGILIGLLISILDFGLGQIGVPNLTRSALVVAIWIALTGGLHLDGAMDTADGLAILDSERRLEVMADSVSGAFGVMAALVIILLKTCALSDLTTDRYFILILAASWGRWAQVLAIGLYPYLKAEGKGAFHKQGMEVPQDILLGVGLLVSISALWLVWDVTRWWLPVITTVGGSVISWLTGAWFHHKLGGHTGDTYGATVEWTETLILCLLTFVGS